VDWARIPDDGTIERTAKALREHGIEVFIVDSGGEAKAKVLELIPQGAEVMQHSSMTLDAIGVSKEIDESGRYNALRNQVWGEKDPEKRTAVRRKANSADYSVGSVHAVTEDGRLVWASNSGSQLAPFGYSSPNVIWVVGAQKIVKDLEQAMKRLEEHALPLEDQRMLKTYGIHSSISKILILNREIVPDRKLKLIIVKEKLGF